MKLLKPSSRMRRELKLVDVYVMSTGAMLSSGLFLLPGIAFGMSGSWVILAYFLSALMAVPAMLSMAELASAMPRAGGAYYFLDRSMGPIVGMVGGLGSWISMGLKSAFALIGIGAYLGIFFDLDITTVALVLTGVFTAINIFGAAETARLQRWLVYILLATLTVFVVAGLVDISGEGLVDRTVERLGAAPGNGLEGLLATIGLVFISYAGLTKVCGVAEEVENPSRNILLGMVLSLATVAVIYTASAYVLVLVLDHQDLPTDLAPIATAAAVVLDWMPGRWGVFIAGAAALAAFASTANVGIMSASRYMLAMGRDDMVGQSFSRLGRFQTPTLAVLFTGAFVAAALLTLDVVGLAKMASAFQLLIFALINIAVIVMRESGIGAYNPAVRSPLYPWVQLVGVFFSVGLIIEMGHVPMLFTLALVAAGVGWFFVYARPRVIRRGAVLHWFERLGRERFDDLEAELRDILLETGLHDGDPFEELLEQAQLVDVDGPATFSEVADLVAERLSGRLPLAAAKIAHEFVLASRAGMIPVEHGAALPHFRIVGLQTHQLVTVRAPAGVIIRSGEEQASGAREVESQVLFFLVSPEEHPGQHLRILAKLASQIERPGFVAEVLAAPDVDSLRELQRGTTVAALAEQLTTRLRHAQPGLRWGHGAPGEFKNILLVSRVGFSADLIERAGHVASMKGAHLTVMGLMERSGRDSEAHSRQTLGKQLEAAAAPLIERGLTVTTDVLVGKPWIEVVRAVLRDGYDLVLVEAPEKDGRLSSFALHLLRKSPCPVWVVRPGQRPRCARILAAVAADPDHPERSAIDATVLSVARRVADHEGAELHVVHAWRVPGEEYMHRRAAMTPQQQEELRISWRASRLRALSAAVEESGLTVSPAEMHLLEGDASEEIPRFAEDNGIDLVVMGTVGRGGVAGVFIGNTAEDVLQSVRCPVLAVKPPGFTTPVRLG